jgi:hypothetical protein
VRSDGVADLVTALCRAELQVGHLDSSSDQRRLKLLLSVVWRAINALTADPPSTRQLTFLRGIVDGVLRDAHHEVPTERRMRFG